MKNFFKNNSKLLIGILIGAIISGGSVYATTQILASNIIYDNSTSGLTSTDVQSALNELYTKSNTWIDPSYINFGTIATNNKKTILASLAGVCIKRNNKVSCMTPNYTLEKERILQIFSDVGTYDNTTLLGCTDETYYRGTYSMYCYGSDFRCDVNYGAGAYTGEQPSSNVSCNDLSDNLYCGVSSDGSVYCF